MKYVKIKAKNYNEALMQLRMKHGDEAIPISHKYVKEGGILNSRFFAKDIVELTAAIQEKKVSTKKRITREKKSNFDVRVDSDVSKSLYKSPGDALKKQIDKYDERNEKKIVSKPVKMQSAVSAVNTKKNDAAIMLTTKEYNDLKKLEKNYYEVKTKLESMMVEKSKNITEKQAEIIDDELMPYKEILEKNDFDEKQTKNIISEVRNAISNDDLANKVKIEKTLKDLIKSKIVVSGQIKSSKKKKIIMFVGPTGVGKTTSLAKLGAIFSLRESKKVSFITIDTYRIAATEQLKKYAEIMKIPVHVVNDQKELHTIVDKEKSDIILIDTAGRSHKNKLKISEIKSYADQINYDFEKILCVSATTKKDDVENIFDSFSEVEFDSVLITKADETTYVGNIVNVAEKHNKPISYVANGQDVPSDIFVAEPDKIVDLMILNDQQQ